jgi:CheY-like chemotaxis protein
LISSNKDRKWVLVVDDEPEIRSSLKEMIELTFGDTVSTIEAKDGLDATNKINCQLFHCIITDLNMPRKEGPAFINSVRQNTFNETTPIIIISGNNSNPDIEKEFEFVHFVPKPFSFEKMTDLIKTQLKIGNNSNRVSADVFNNLILATREFIAHITQKEATPQSLLTIKSMGQAVEQDLVSSIQVKMGKVNNTFSLLVYSKDMLQLINSNEGLKSKLPEQVMSSMSFVILKHVLGEFGTINRDDFKANSISNDRERLNDKSGLSILVGNEDLSVGIFATTK